MLHNLCVDCITPAYKHTKFVFFLCFYPGKFKNCYCNCMIYIVQRISTSEQGR